MRLRQDFDELLELGAIHRVQLGLPLPVDFDSEHASQRLHFVAKTLRKSFVAALFEPLVAALFDCCGHGMPVHAMRQEGATVHLPRYSRNAKGRRLGQPL